MDTVQFIALWAHILAGHISLLTGTIIMFARKGNTRHAFWGRCFFYSMTVVGFSSIYLSVSLANSFLMHVGIFSLYLNISGWRSIRFRKLIPRWPDILINLVALANGLLMVLSQKLILMVFGAITLLLISLDLQWYWLYFMKKQHAGNRWLGRHIGMMVGAFISALTAFLTVNVSFNGPAWIIWLSPTIILVPVMQYWIHRYTKRQKENLIPF